MGDMDWFERAGRAFGGWIGARKTERQAKKAREQNQRFIDQLDWEPEYASDHVKPYQKTQSPVARAYLESTLLGVNPDTTWSGDTNAKYKLAAQQRTKDNLFGTPEQLAAQSKAVQADNSNYQVDPITRPVKSGTSLYTDSLNVDNDGIQRAYQQVHDYLGKQGMDTRQQNEQIQKLLAKYKYIDVVADQIRQGRKV